MPKSFQDAFKVLFPNGVDDHKRQVEELYEHFDKRIQKDDLASNLIFVLTGYLLTKNFVTKEHAVHALLGRKGDVLKKAEAEYLHDYALNNHPKLSSVATLREIESLMGSDGCDSDTIPGGTGMFGLNWDNPIPTKGVSGIYDYLSRLYDNECNKIEYTRTGTVNSSATHHPVDVFRICSPKGTKAMYFSAYHKRTSQLSPSGYLLVDYNRIIISSCYGDGLLGYRLTDKTNSLPRLLNLNTFSSLSNDELLDKSESFQEAEKKNQEAITLYNNKDVEKALIAFDKAISLGSLNAINNKFAALHSEERYSEALELLQNIVNTPNATVSCLYNLAVLCYNGDFDTHYNLERNISRSYTLLLKASNLIGNGKEEIGDHFEEQVNGLISRLEKEDNSLLEIKSKLQSTTDTKTDSIPKREDEANLSIADILGIDIIQSTDIEGNDLRGRLSDIYSCINAGADNMIDNIVGLPTVSDEGKMEIEILMAAILSYRVEKGIVIQSLLSGNPSFNSVGLTNISNAMDAYLNMYKHVIIKEGIKVRCSLKEFAKSHGKLKLGHLQEKDKYGNIKAPIFVGDDSKMTVCHFALFSEEEQTGEFISKNWNNIIVDETDEGEYVFRLIENINNDYCSFLEYIAYYIYCSPLNYKSVLWSGTIKNELSNIKIQDSNIIITYDIHNMSRINANNSSDIPPYIDCALDQGIYMLENMCFCLSILENGLRK